MRCRCAITNGAKFVPYCDLSSGTYLYNYLLSLKAEQFARINYIRYR